MCSRRLIPSNYYKAVVRQLLCRPTTSHSHQRLATASRCLRTMLRQLLLSLGLLQVGPALLASCHSHMDESGPVLEDAGQPRYPSLVQMFKDTHLPGEDLKQVALKMPVDQDSLMPEASMMVMSTALQAQGRDERSPRRCVRVQESCLGYKLPCCDPCATCYCRFFNANCFCKKFSSTFPCGRN